MASLLFSLYLFLVPAICFAADESSNFLHQTIQMVVALFFVVALIYVIFKLLLPKFLKIGYGASSVVKILARQHLGTKKNIYVIEACEKYYLIGVTEHNITNLGEVSAEYVKGNLLQKAQP